MHRLPDMYLTASVSVALALGVSCTSAAAYQSDLVRGIVIGFSELQEEILQTQTPGADSTAALRRLEEAANDATGSFLLSDGRAEDWVATYQSGIFHYCGDGPRRQLISRAIEIASDAEEVRADHIVIASIGLLLARMKPGDHDAGYQAAFSHETLMRTIWRPPSRRDALRSSNASIVLSALIGDGAPKITTDDLISVLTDIGTTPPAEAAWAADTLYRFGLKNPDLDQSVRDHMSRVAHAWYIAGIRLAHQHDDAATASHFDSQLRALQGRSWQGTLIGGMAPALDFRWSSDPELVSLADLQGRVVVLEFWASWCPHCIASIGKLRTIREAYQHFSSRLNLSIDKHLL